MSLIADDQVPIGLLELGLDVLVAAQLVEATDDERVLVEPVAGPGCFELVVGHDLERKVEPAVQLVLPLLDEAPRAHDQATLQVPSGHQLLDQQAGHDRLARPRIIGEQETQRLPLEHLVVDGRDLVGQRIHQRSVDGEERIEQVGELDAVGLGHETEEGAVAVEAPRPTLGDHFEARLAFAIDQLISQIPDGVLVCDLDRDDAQPLDVEHRGEALR